MATYKQLKSMSRTKLINYVKKTEKTFFEFCYINDIKNKFDLIKENAEEMFFDKNITGEEYRGILMCYRDTKIIIDELYKYLRNLYEEL